MSHCSGYLNLWCKLTPVWGKFIQAIGNCGCVQCDVDFENEWGHVPVHCEGVSVAMRARVSRNLRARRPRQTVIVNVKLNLI